MKKLLSLFSLLVVLTSCENKNKIEKEVEEIPVTIKVERFDKIFYESPVENLQNVKQKYPYFFPAQTPDSVWVNKINNPLYRELYSEVQKKYSNFEKVNSNLESLFKHIKYYFPREYIYFLVKYGYNIDQCIKNIKYLYDKSRK